MAVLYGSCTITGALFFEDDLDPSFARSRVRERLSRLATSLPVGVIRARSAAGGKDFHELLDGLLAIEPRVDDGAAAASQVTAPGRGAQELLDGRRQGLRVLLANEDPGVAGLDQLRDARHLC